MDDELARLRAALEFYANPENWWSRGVDPVTREPLQCAIDEDSGRIAREALGISQLFFVHKDEHLDW